jgi:Zn finger protein HypA/HybF involved in hydrogenase expression
MIHLPVLQHLSVDGYGLYPGTETVPGLHATFEPGLSLILGTNGLGKTTLVTIIYRILTGPVDIPALDEGGNLGDKRLEIRPLRPPSRRTFASRVRDDAVAAEARLAFRLGKAFLEVTRSLSSLSLTRLTCDSVEIDPTEGNYQDLIQRETELSSYGDWVLVLRHLTFYFEDRRALVWDASAQRQLLRLLFLPPKQALDWTRREREVLELDSAVRNLQYAVGREERTIARLESSLGSAAEIRQQLKLLQAVQATDETTLAELNDELASAVAERQTARVEALAIEQAHESALRNVERLQLRAIEATFPTAAETAKYLIGHILAEETCLTCGTHVPRFAKALQDRLRGHQCPICGSAVEDSDSHRENGRRLLAAAVKKVQATEEQLEAAKTNRASAEKSYDDILSEISRLTESTARRSADIDDLVRRLPPDEQAAHQQRSGLAAIRSRLELQRNELEIVRTQFQQFVAQLNGKIATQKGHIKQAFEKYATGFLFEDCTLMWAPRKARVGQTGALVEFAAFELEMSGTNFASPVRRTGPQQVSESQREFIDLSFRMALMEVASETGGTLIIDAPESSLDAVFVRQAAAVLTRFGNVEAGNRNVEAGNRLIVTSNLVDGDLIPELLRRSKIVSSRDRRVIDLLRIAAPTVATKRLHKEYAEVRRRLFRRAGEGGSMP